LSEPHGQPHLASGDVAAGQGAVPHRHEDAPSYPAGRDRQRAPPPGRRQSPGAQCRSGYALPPSQTRRHFLILIDASLAPCSPRCTRKPSWPASLPWWSARRTRPRQPRHRAAPPKRRMAAGGRE
jgi:hypothetical protein